MQQMCIIISHCMTLCGTVFLYKLCYHCSMNLHFYSITFGKHAITLYGGFFQGAFRAKNILRYSFATGKRINVSIPSNLIS